MQEPVEKQPVWSPTQVQFLYRHQNKRYYVHTCAAGKEKWTGLRTTLSSVVRNRNSTVVTAARKMVKTTRRERAIGGLVKLSTREELSLLVETIRSAGVGDCGAPGPSTCNIGRS